MGAAGLIHAVSAEIKKRLRCKRQVLSYNISDRAPVGKVKQVILSSGVTNKACRCVKLHRDFQCLCCPLLVKFIDEAFAVAILRSSDFHPMLLSTKISPAHTPLHSSISENCFLIKLLESHCFLLYQMRCA